MSKSSPTSHVIPAAEVILIGSGHSHLEVIRRYGALDTKPYRLTLINEAPVAAYAGMLPTVVSGNGDRNDAFIDLGHLCQQNHVRFVKSRVTKVTPDSREIHIDRSPLTLHYEALSIDLGRRPAPQEIRGWSRDKELFTDHLWNFVQSLERLDEELVAAEKTMHLVAVGADAPGLELLLAIAERYRDQKLDITLVVERGELLPDLPAKVSQTFVKWLAEAKVTILLNASITHAELAHLVLTTGQKIPADIVYWGQAGRNPEILSHCGIKLNAAGQIAVNENLESSSHSGVYAAGDSAGVDSAISISKTGVYGRQMGRVLAENLTRRFTGLAQLVYQSRPMPLTFFSYGNKSAIGMFGKWSLTTPQLIGVKARWDEKRMRSFRPAPGVTRVPTFIESGNMAETPCSASGATLPPDLLDAIPQRLSRTNMQSVDRSTGETILTIGEGKDRRKLVQAVNYHRTFTEDLYSFGRITATHCLTSVYASGLQPLSSHVLATIGFGPKRAMTEDLSLLLDGVTSVLDRDKVSLAGCHSQFGLEPGIGMMVQALTDIGSQEPIWTPSNAQIGDVLILTKPLGSGILFAAHSRYKLSSDDFYQAIELMSASHADALAMCHRHGVRTSSGIGGYGLCWHLREIAQQSGVHIAIDLDQIPIYQGVLSALHLGIRASLHIQNRTPFDRSLQGLNKAELVIAESLFDPQTAAGIVVAVPAESAGALLSALHATGLGGAAVIGRLLPVDDGYPVIRLRRDH